MENADADPMPLPSSVSVMANSDAANATFVFQNEEHTLGNALRWVVVAAAPAVALRSVRVIHAPLHPSFSLSQLVLHFLTSR
jgi:DNA-directed RNA polymerase subunit L